MKLDQKLTPKQARFVEEYLKDLNATQAAKRAGYSAKTSGWIGQQLLAKTHIAKCIADRVQARSDRTQVDLDGVLVRLAAMVDADMADLYGPEGELLPAQKWPDVWRKGLVSGLDVVEEKRGDEVVAVVRKVRLAERDAGATLFELARRWGLSKSGVKGIVDGRRRGQVGPKVLRQPARVVLVNVGVVLTRQERSRFERLGGVRWLRESIERADGVRLSAECDVGIES